MTTALLLTWQSTLVAAGLERIQVVEDDTSEGQLMFGVALFRWHDLLIRVARDRGEDAVDIAPVADPQRFFRLDDIGVAQGWRQVADVVKRSSPPALFDEMCELVRHRDQVDRDFSELHLARSRVAIDTAHFEIGAAFLEKLERIRRRR